MATVVVYILTADPSSDRVRRLKFLFDNPFFRVKPVNITPPAGITGNSNITTDQIIEAYRVTTILTDAKVKYSDKYIIVLKDSSSTNVSSSDISEIIIAAINEAGWDLCYLCRWLDRCDLYRNPRPIGNKTSSLTRTFSPNGVQAILLSPQGRDILLGHAAMKDGKYFPPVTKPLGTQLNEQIGRGNIISNCIVPNVFEFDVTLATTVTDLAKLSECRRPENNGSNNGVFPFVLFLVIVIGVFLLAWALYYLVGPVGSAKNKK